MIQTFLDPSRILVVKTSRQVSSMLFVLPQRLIPDNMGLIELLKLSPSKGCPSSLLAKTDSNRELKAASSCVATADVSSEIVSGKAESAGRVERGKCFNDSPFLIVSNP